MYLKLDKKLIVDIDYLNVEQKDSKFDLGNLKQDILSIPYILKYFQAINLKNITMNDERYSLYFSKNRFIINSKEFKIDTTPNFFGHTIELDLENIYIKKYNLNLNGKLTINIFKNEAYYLGDIVYKENKLNLNVKSTLENIDFYIQSGDIDNINFIKDFITLDRSIEKWLYTNVLGTHNINYLTFRYDILRNKLISDSIELDTDIRNATVKFHDELSEVNTKNVNIKFKKDHLYFTFDKPVYKSVSLDNSTLKITNINSDKKSMLLLNLYSTSVLNEDIKEILAGYGITIPVTQNSGTLSTNINISLDLQSDEVDVKGIVDIRDAEILVGNLPFDITTAKVTIDNSNVDINSNRTFLFDKQLNLNIDKLSIDTKSFIAIGDLFINSFLIENDTSTTILNLKDKATSIGLYFKDNIQINLPQLNCTVNSSIDKTSVKLNTIKGLAENSPILKENKIINGDLLLIFQNNGDIDFISTITEHDSPLMLKTIDLIGNIKNNNFKIVSKDKQLSIESQKNLTTVKIDKINIDKSKLPELGNNTSKGKEFIFIGEDSNIVLDKEKNKILLASDFVYKSIYKKSDFTLNHKSTKLTLVTKGNSSEINIKNIDKEFLNSFLGNNDFITSGTIDIHGKTIKDTDKIFRGEIDLKDTNLKDFAALNQVITLLQSSSAVANPILALPTLFRVVKGDITLNGYKALEGKVKYVYNHENEFLNLYDIKTIGAEIDFDGNAKINLKDRTIDSKIKVIFLKDITLIAEKLPLVNKILLDDKKRISSEVKIYGDLEKPKSEFSLLNN